MSVINCGLKMAKYWNLELKLFSVCGEMWRGFNLACVDVLMVWYTRLFVVYKIVSKGKLGKSVNRSRDNIKTSFKNVVPVS